MHGTLEPEKERISSHSRITAEAISQVGAVAIKLVFSEGELRLG